jgi:hypothetical protein
MGPQYRVLPERTVGGHVVSGFASQVEDKLHLLLYSHHALDTESRSEAQFDVTLNLAGLKPQKVQVQEYRFDKDHNSYFRLGRQLRDEALERPQDAAQLARFQEAVRQIESDSRDVQLEGLGRLGELGPAAAQAAGPIWRLLQKTSDPAVREKATAMLLRIHAPRAYPASEVRKVQELAALRSTGASSHGVGADGRLQLNLRLAGNGANWISIAPQSD